MTSVFGKILSILINSHSKNLTFFERKFYIKVHCIFFDFSDVQISDFDEHFVQWLLPQIGVV